MQQQSRSVHASLQCAAAVAAEWARPASQPHTAQQGRCTYVGAGSWVAAAAAKAVAAGRSPSPCIPRLVSISASTEHHLLSPNRHGGAHVAGAVQPAPAAAAAVVTEGGKSPAAQQLWPAVAVVTSATPTAASDAASVSGDAEGQQRDRMASTSCGSDLRRCIGAASSGAARW